MLFSNMPVWQEMAILFAVLAVSVYLRNWSFREKPAKEPEQTVAATVLRKEIVQGAHQSGRSKGGYSYTVTFRTDAGQELTLFAHEVEFGGLKEGAKGTLTYEGRYFVSFA